MKFAELFGITRMELVELSKKGLTEKSMGMSSIKLSNSSTRSIIAFRNCMVDRVRRLEVRVGKIYESIILDHLTFATSS